MHIADGNQIEAVVFDLGNVLVDFDHRIAAQRISGFCDKTPLQIYELFFDSEITGLFEEGKIPPDDFFLRIKQMLNLKLDYKSFLPIWNEIFFISDKNRSVHNIASKLKSRYKLAVLSNINTLHLEFIKARFDVFGAFHHLIASCEAGLKKPDRAIYEKTIKLLGVPAESIFYTDDRPELVSAGSLSGIRSFVFKDIRQLRMDLASIGIDVD